jgi:hypothetical protein
LESGYECGVLRQAASDYKQTPSETLQGEFTQESLNKNADVYGLFMKFLMVELGHIMSDHFPGDKVMIVHDSSEYDVAALEAFKSMVDDPTWKNRTLFHSITSLDWKTSIGLQAADFAAYETFKAVKNTLNLTDKSLGYALNWLRTGEQPMRARYVSEGTVDGLNQLILEQKP